MTQPPTPADRAYFDQLYAGGQDPYGVHARWYEARKRAVLMASLPRRRYRQAYEPGRGAAALTLELAMRCDRTVERRAVKQWRSQWSLYS